MSAACSTLAFAALLYAGISYANDNCGDSNGIYYCTGDQSEGVQNEHGGLGTNTDYVLVERLNQDIGPNLATGRPAGLTFKYSEGDSLTTLNLQYVENTYEINVNETSSGGSYGILFDSAPKNGKSGSYEAFEDGKRGHDGGDGRALNLTLGDGSPVRKIEAAKTRLAASMRPALAAMVGMAETPARPVGVAGAMLEMAGRSPSSAR